MVDHRNGNTLDNRRCNLRVATLLQNNCNRAGYGQWKYKGIELVSPGRWRAVFQIHGQRYRSPSYGSQVDAARAYDELAFKYAGEHAKLNFR